MDQIVVTAILSALMAVLGFVGSKYIDRYENFEEKVRNSLDNLDRRVEALEKDSATKIELVAAAKKVSEEIRNYIELSRKN